ncbi:DNA adenine methylase [Paracoccus bogoriensis]|uniref:DNA adenine methylase n=1 Tax=Paracoccus bogoriensis TaxID=242065 RepID=UPI001CA4BB30|nr:DNA adenine methylase [Paracoccus bogoriensis]MBW7057622.1 DNA adenine methylase [Paracoccus bogoriensis]
MNKQMPTIDSDLMRPEQLDFFGPAKTSGEYDEFLSEQLITYIGNKRRLLPLIQSALLRALEILGKENVSFADVFAGTGVVSRLARRWSHTLYINDFEAYSAFSNRVYHTNRSTVDVSAVEAALREVNRIASESPYAGFITELYSPADESLITKDDRVFYTRRNAMFIDTARQEIDKLPENIRPYLLAPLIQRASVHVNTSGVFKGFYKNKSGVGQFGGSMRNALQRICAPIEIPFPVFSRFERNVYVTQSEAADFVESLPQVDVAYFDPPYNQHPYGSNYFMLNLILEGRRPTEISRVSGIPNDWKRSDYNVRGRAARALKNVMDRCPARILMVSYNSEGFISIDEMMEMLEGLGAVTVFDQEYNTFRGCRNLSGRSAHVTEFLFKVERRD